MSALERQRLSSGAALRGERAVAWPIRADGSMRRTDTPPPALAGSSVRRVDHTGAAWRGASPSLTLFITAITTMAIAQATAVGITGRLFPWIVNVTALAWVPLPGQVANVAAGFALLAAVCAPFEHRGRSAPRTPPDRAGAHHVNGGVRGTGRHTQRRSWHLGAAVAVLAIAILTGCAVALTAAKSARTQPDLIQNASRTQHRGETALAFETLAPATSGPYDRGKLSLYLLVSGWAGDLHDWSVAAHLSVYLMRAAVAGENPEAIVEGLVQYDVYSQNPLPPPSILARVTASAPSGRWRSAVHLLLTLPTARDRSDIALAITGMAVHLAPRLRTRLVDSVVLLLADTPAGLVRP